MLTATCRGPRCGRVAPAVAVVDQWPALTVGGRPYRCCSALCIADVAEQLATAGTIPARPDLLSGVATDRGAG